MYRRINTSRPDWYAEEFSQQSPRTSRTHQFEEKKKKRKGQNKREQTNHTTTAPNNYHPQQQLTTVQNETYGSSTPMILPHPPLVSVPDSTTRQKVERTTCWSTKIPRPSYLDDLNKVLGSQPQNRVLKRDTHNEHCREKRIGSW